jgi:hypothetical protein
MIPFPLMTALVESAASRKFLVSQMELVAQKCIGAPIR